MLTHSRTHTNIIILVLIFLLFVSRSRFLSLFGPTKAPIVHDRISIWWKLKAGVALLFHLGVGGADFSASLPSLLVSVGPVPHARLHWVMSSRLFGRFWRPLSLSIFCLGDSFAPSVHLVHQPGSHSLRQPFTSLTHFISHLVYISQRTAFIGKRGYLLQPPGVICCQFHLQKLFSGRIKTLMNFYEVLKSFFLKKTTFCVCPKRTCNSSAKYDTENQN